MEVVTFPKLGLEFNVSRVAFSIGGFDIYWYGLLIGTGLLLAMLFALRKSKEFGLDQNKFIDVIIFGIIGGVIGARLYYVAFSPRDDFSTLRSILDLRNGGMAFYGAVIGGVLFAVITAKLEKVKILPVLDLVGIGFLLGQGIGRWGNFANQEAFGTNTDLPWGMYSKAIQRYIYMHSDELAERGIRVFQYSPVHPTFLYESLWCILGFVLLALYIKHRKFDGEIFLMFLFWNGFLRMFIEGLRLDSLYIGNVRISQLLAAIMAFAALAGIILVRNKIKLSGNPNYLKPYGHTAEWAEEYRLILEKEEAEKNKKKSSKKIIKEDAKNAVLNAEDTEEPVKEAEEAETSDAAAETAETAETAAEVTTEDDVPEELPEEIPAEIENNDIAAEVETVEAEAVEVETTADESADTAEEVTDDQEPETESAEVTAADTEAETKPETAESEETVTEGKADDVKGEEAPKKKTTRKKSSGTQGSGSKKKSSGTQKNAGTKKTSGTKKTTGTKKTNSSSKSSQSKKRSSSKAKAEPTAKAEDEAKD